MPQLEHIEAIEKRLWKAADYDNLRGALPKNEYRELNNDVLGQRLRNLNSDELKQVSGDVFGRIYEYFLTQFADQKAHDGGVAPEEEDEDFDFEETLREIHLELEDLNAEAVTLAATIAKNFKGLGV